jgi:hypothetical protein
MKPILLIGLLWLALSAHAAPRVIATINDPAGDDDGSGSLVPPQRNDFQPGDLDLVQLQLSRDDEGYWFEATFKNPIRDPANAFGTIGSEPLSNIARKGFYQFNLDIYIDIDRVNGSGNMFTLPGRKVSIDPTFAWERAVILTPRPEAMRAQLLEVMERQFPDRPKGEAAASIDQAMFFPTRVRVRNKSVIFLVPAKFVGDSDAKGWAVTAFVTGAKTDIAVNLPLLPSSKTPLDELDLGVMQPSVGRPRDTFGYVGTSAPSPIVDLLAPAADQQPRLLAAKAALIGVALNSPAASAPAEAPAPSARPNAQPTARPAAPAGSAWGDPPANGLASDEPPAGKPVTAAPTPAPAPTSLQNMLQPAKRLGPGASAEAAAPARPTVAKRLEALQQLFDQKLISEDEYKQQRQRILNEL